MSFTPRYSCKTVRPLLFNDPEKGSVYEIPAGTHCVLVKDVDEACKQGYLDRRNEGAMWAAKTNLHRGFCLLWLNGVLRGVSKEDIEQQ